MKDEQGFSGVWRTVKGRRVFIRDGEELGEAMKRSGKFNNIGLSKEQKADRSYQLKLEKKELQKKILAGIDEKDYIEYKKRIREITQEKEELDKDLTEEDRKEARHRAETGQKSKTLEEEQSTENIEQYTKDLEKEFDKDFEILGNEDENQGKGIEANYVEGDMFQSKVYAKVSEMYDNGEISEKDWDKFVEKHNDLISTKMSEAGYELIENNGQMYYSQLPKAQKNYDKVVDFLNAKGLDYKISRSWNPGELPSIYVTKNDETFRIANHYNDKNQEFSAFDTEKNKIYKIKDYINYKDTILEDLKDWLKNI